MSNQEQPFPILGIFLGIFFMGMALDGFLVSFRLDMDCGPGIFQVSFNMNPLQGQHKSFKRAYFLAHAIAATPLPILKWSLILFHVAPPLWRIQ